jgi:ABC-type transport system involved in Fe-S cluster assembly fused permease/ATPase subunit
VVDIPNARCLQITDKKVTFKNVTFSYITGKVVLKNVSFVVNPGETVALVGCLYHLRTLCMHCSVIVMSKVCTHCC